MKRSRSESKAMDVAILQLFKEYPEAKLVENKYKTLRKLLTDRYHILRDIPRELMYKIIFDTVSLDRKLRLWTEGEQKELKETLSDQFIVDELQ